MLTNLPRRRVQKNKTSLGVSLGLPTHQVSLQGIKCNIFPMEVEVLSLTEQTWSGHRTFYPTTE